MSQETPEEREARHVREREKRREDQEGVVRFFLVGPITNGETCPGPLQDKAREICTAFLRVQELRQKLTRAEKRLWDLSNDYGRQRLNLFPTADRTRFPREPRQDYPPRLEATMGGSLKINFVSVGEDAVWSVLSEEVKTLKRGG